MTEFIHGREHLIPWENHLLTDPTPLPWRVAGDGYAVHVLDRDGRHVATFWGHPFYSDKKNQHKQALANAQKIVDAVNKGVSDG